MKQLGCFLICITFHLYSISQDVKGLYVDNFQTILGTDNLEDSLLRFSQNNGFNYLMLYNLHQIGIQTTQGSDKLAAFIEKAKSVYHISNIGGGSENFEFIRDYLHVYNQSQPDSLTMLDVYNLEFEFWNTLAVDTGGYYCQYYLAPNNLTCNVDGAFIYYQNTLTQIDSLAETLNLKSEAYLGWFDSIQAVGLINTGVDRLFLHIYVPSNTFNQNHQYNYVKDRLKYLGAVNTPITVFPLYSSEPEFMQSWAAANDFFEPYNLLINSIQSDTGSWKTNLNITGIQWFAYSFMPKKNMDLGLSESDNTFKIARSGDSYTILAETDEKFRFILTDLNGKFILRGTDEGAQFSTVGLAEGVYLLKISAQSGEKSVRILR